METPTCPICGLVACHQEVCVGFPIYTFIKCDTYNYELFIEKVLLDYQDKRKQKQLLNLIFERLLRHPKMRDRGEDLSWRFFYDEKHTSNSPSWINLAEEFETYPNNIIERCNRALLNLSLLHPDIGSFFSINLNKYRLLYCTSENESREAYEVIDQLAELGYATRVSRGNWKITVKGWLKIEELTKSLAEVNQGFIAMSYSEEAKPILEAFRSAIKGSGYVARVIGEKEHNHQIVPEMFFEIKRSKFMVVDVTYANFGAYYEAGYAEALGKEVIVCCNKKEVNSNKRRKRPHFDIAQKSMVVWETLDELKEKLITRIRATVH